MIKTLKQLPWRAAQLARSMASRLSAPPAWTLADVTDNGERVTHLYPNDCYFAHLSLYYFPLSYLQGATVLDAGSGTGYGTAYLADHGARFVYGIDASAKAVAFSRQQFARRNLHFQVMNLEKIYGFRDHQFDVVFSSNTLEHISNLPAALRTLSKLLQPQGTLIIAVPPIVNEDLRAQNLAIPFHLNIWSPRQWAHVLGQYFADVQAYQHWYDKPGAGINLLNAPADTVLNEKDFTFDPIAVDELYHRQSISAIFTARQPLAAHQLPPPGSPLSFVDDSFTRPLAVPSPTVWGPLLTRAGEVMRQQGVRAVGQKSAAYVLRKLRERGV